MISDETWFDLIIYDEIWWVIIISDEIWLGSQNKF